MLCFLLDEQMFPGLVDILKTADPAIEAHCVHFWRGGRLLNQPDERILNEAREAKLTLVSFDVTTIPPLLARMAQREEDHGGMIFLSSKSFRQNDQGAIARALAELWNAARHDDWLNRTVFLQKKG